MSSFAKLKNKKRIKSHKTEQQCKSKNRIFNNLQKMINQDPPLTLKSKCKCEMCQFQKKQSQVDEPSHLQNQFGSDQNLYKILRILTKDQVLIYELHLKIPNISFYKSGVFTTFHCTLKGQLNPPFVSSKFSQIYSFMKKYEENVLKSQQLFYQNKSLESLNQKFIHKNYFDKVFPKYFLQSTESESLRKNRNQKRNYIIHDNDKYIVQEIQQHQLKKTQPFCIFRYTDLTYEINTLQETELNTRKSFKKLDKVISYVESFTRIKKNAPSVFFSEFVKGKSEYTELYMFAMKQILIIRGDIGRQHSQFIPRNQLKLMKQRYLKNPQDNTHYTTFKIVILLEIIEDFKIQKLRIKWILSQQDEIILQEIPQLLFDDILMREVKKNKTINSPRYKQIFTTTRLKILQNREVIKKKMRERYDEENSHEKSLQILPQIKKRKYNSNQNSKSSLKDKSIKSMLSTQQLKDREKHYFILRRNPFERQKTYKLRAFKTEVSQSKQ